MKIEGVQIGPGHKPYIVAELSANHNGKLDRALESITSAQAMGADAVKIQTYTAETMTIDCDREDFMVRGGLWDGYKLYDLYKWAETPYEWHAEMIAHARKVGITIFSTPFDETAVDLLESLDTPAYKIASFEVADLPLIRYVAKTGKPMIMSTGMATEDEIGDAVTAAREAGCKDLVLLHCISSYPAPAEQMNLRQIQKLSEQFDTLPGLSDHTMGITIPVAAVALGACLIEKHFTLSRADKGPDSEFSLEPDELRQLCETTKTAWTALGAPGYARQPAESKSRVFRRSLYFVRDRKAGDRVTAEDIRRIRPGMGLAPKFLDQLIGKTLKENVARGMATSWSQFESE